MVPLDSSFVSLKKPSIKNEVIEINGSRVRYLIPLAINKSIPANKRSGIQRKTLNINLYILQSLWWSVPLDPVEPELITRLFIQFWQCRKTSLMS